MKYTYFTINCIYWLLLLPSCFFLQLRHRVAAVPLPRPGGGTAPATSPASTDGSGGGWAAGTAGFGRGRRTCGTAVRGAALGSTATTATAARAGRGARELSCASDGVAVTERYWRLVYSVASTRTFSHFIIVEAEAYRASPPSTRLCRCCMLWGRKGRGVSLNGTPVSGVNERMRWEISMQPLHFHSSAFL
jgi:hypothetical protein